MKKIITGLCTVFVSLTFFSCQKDVSDNPSSGQVDILGNWKFISMDVKTKSIAEANDGSESLKTVTTTDYITANNTGSITIDASKMSSSNLSYYINTTGSSYIYENGSLTDSLIFPFQFTAPATSSIANYRLVGTDSVYFESGSMFMNGVTQPTQSSGAKLKFEGDMLYLIQSIAQSKTENIQGTTVISNVQASVTVGLQRQ